jgi:hypothetical protein
VSLEADATWALVFRREELDLVLGWLRSADAGVVLAGAGGVGKTRLAVEACGMVGEDLSVEWCVAPQTLSCMRVAHFAERCAHPLGEFELAAGARACPRSPAGEPVSG